MTDIQINDARSLFLYLANAVMCIPKQYQERVFIDMAHKLHEWANVPHSELKKVLEEFDIDYNNTCCVCEDEIEDDDSDTCEKCK